MTSDQSAEFEATPNLDALPVQGDVRGECGARHRRLLKDANVALAASPAPALMERVQTIHRILLAANPKALRSSVGWFGRLLGRDIVLQAEAEALRHGLGVHVLQARQQLDVLVKHDLQLRALGAESHSAIAEVEQQSAVLAGAMVTENGSSDAARQLQHLVTLATSSRTTASHLELTLLNHRDLIQRVEQMLPRVELLLDQQRMLQTGVTEQAAFAAATDALEALQGLEHVDVASAGHDIATSNAATPR